MYVCIDRCLGYRLTCNKCKMQYVGQTILTSFGQDGAITKVTRESMVRELHVCNSICLTIFYLWSLRFLRGGLINLYR